MPNQPQPPDPDPPKRHPHHPATTDAVITTALPSPATPPPSSSAPRNDQPTPHHNHQDRPPSATAPEQIAAPATHVDDEAGMGNKASTARAIGGSRDASAEVREERQQRGEEMEGEEPLIPLRPPFLPFGAGGEEGDVLVEGGGGGERVGGGENAGGRRGAGAEERSGDEVEFVEERPKEAGKKSSSGGPDVQIMGVRNARLRTAATTTTPRTNIRQKNPWTVESRSGVGWKKKKKDPRRQQEKMSTMRGMGIVFEDSGSAERGGAVSRAVDSASTASSTPVGSRAVTPVPSNRPAKRPREPSVPSASGPLEKKVMLDDPRLALLDKALPRTKDFVPTLERLLEDAKTQNRDIHDYKTRVSLLQAENNRKQKIIDSFNSGNAVSVELQAQSDKFASLLQRKTEQLGKKDEELAEMSRKRTEWKKQYLELKKGAEAEWKSVGRLGSVKDRLQEKVESLEETARSLSNDKKAMSKEYTAKRNEAESLNRKLGSTEKKLEKAKKKIADLEEDVEGWKEELSNSQKILKEERSERKKEHSGLNQEIKELNREDKKKGGTIEVLRKKLNDTEARLKNAKDKKGYCDLCGNMVFHLFLHFAFQFCEDYQHDNSTSPAQLQKIIEMAQKKFSELSDLRNKGKNHVLRNPRLYEIKDEPPKASTVNNSGLVAEAAKDGLCEMCSNDEVAKALYWVVEACQNPENSEFWHPELVRHMYAWHDSFPKIVERCEAGCQLVRPANQNTDEETEEEQAEGNNDEVHMEAEEPVKSKVPHEEYYILLLRVQQTLQVFADLNMPLLELGGAYKDFKGKVDKRKEDGGGKFGFQDRLDGGKLLLEERVKCWADMTDDRRVESGERVDHTPMSVKPPANLVKLLKELEQKKNELAGVLARAAESREGRASFDQFMGEVKDPACTSLAEKYGVPCSHTGVPLVRQKLSHLPTQIQATPERPRLQHTQPEQKVDDEKRDGEDGAGFSRATSLGSS
ncbi:hypothetical protein GTA08_BOTSDO12107 [Botryosphaeria dothidea]|uniref:Uncharacterized protein n=1 Tax=Botryosphaeria dothidea TaxID=55169 RepID=A0A8H4J2H7_9PEZI|nr:hypothetical protein GTA08_BOTSDO12107 [Botryosphaeria dothidea]